SPQRRSSDLIVGPPHSLSSTTLRPLGPRVTLTASASWFIPRSRPRRASSSNAIIFEVITAPALDGRAGTAPATDGPLADLAVPGHALRLALSRRECQAPPALYPLFARRALCACHANSG